MARKRRRRHGGGGAGRRRSRRRRRRRLRLGDLARHRGVPDGHVDGRLVPLADEGVLQQLLVLGPVLVVFSQTAKKNKKQNTNANNSLHDFSIERTGIISWQSLENVFESAVGVSRKDWESANGVHGRKNESTTAGFSPSFRDGDEVERCSETPTHTHTRTQRKETHRKSARVLKSRP